jgi:hypothetical protein
MKTSSQKMLVWIFLLAISIPSLQASKIGTLSTVVSGGIDGNKSGFTPFVAFKGGKALFADKTVIPQAGTASFTLASDLDDPNFAAFIQQLTDSKDEFLSVGHSIGGVTSDVASLESAWFGGLVFEGKKVSHITLTYSNLKFDKSATSDEWTNFSYELTLTVFSNSDNDGVATRNSDNDGVATRNSDNDGVATRNSDNDGVAAVDMSKVDYSSMSKMSGASYAKGENGTEIVQTKEGKFIIIRTVAEQQPKSKEEIKKMTIKLTYLSTMGLIGNIGTE